MAKGKNKPGKQAKKPAGKAGKKGKAPWDPLDVMMAKSKGKGKKSC